MGYFKFGTYVDFEFGEGAYGFVVFLADGDDALEES
tara:strand:+ start:1020 stop:1127 length:108 start_codon:yes stop_codon:yes gene_type:complete